MYDTIKLRLDTTNGERCMSKLTETTTVINPGTSEWLYSRGKLQNFKVRVSVSSIWITGSLARFHFGSNVETLPLEETARAIEHLSDELNQPMAHARVFRLDVPKTFAMARRPSEYWGYSLTPARMARHEYPGQSLTFANKQRSLVFYDKLAEMRHRRTGSQDWVGNGKLSRFAGQTNLLRYEVQFKRRLNLVFSEQEIRATRLSEPDFYEKCSKGGGQSTSNWREFGRSHDLLLRFA